jgi:lactobin A/cerein 7B family class IIb bacteriocin
MIAILDLTETGSTWLTEETQKSNFSELTEEELIQIQGGISPLIVGGAVGALGGAIGGYATGGLAGAAGGAVSGGIAGVFNPIGTVGSVGSSLLVGIGSGVVGGTVSNLVNRAQGNNTLSLSKPKEQYINGVRVA